MQDTYYLGQEKYSFGSCGEMLVKGQGGGWDAVLWWTPAGRHHDCSLHGALMQTVCTASEVVAAAEEVVFLSRNPTRTPLSEIINIANEFAR